MNLAYWLETPADDWERAIPIGNGRLGASVWGNIDNERITINEEHMWYGADRERRNESAGQYVGKIRELLLQGKVEDAQFLCQMAMTGTPKYIAPYQMACDLNFLFFYEKENGAAAKKGQRRTNEYAHERISGYRRELDMECAVTRVRFRHDLTDYEREFFVSARYQVLAMRIRAGGKGKLRFQFNINRRPFEERSGGDGENLIYLEGRCGDGAGYYGAALLGEHDGKSCRIGDYLAVWDAAEAVVYFDFETDQSGERPGEKCRSRLFRAVRAGYGTILREHVRDYRSLFDRMRLEIADRDFGDVPMGQLLARTEESAVRRYLMQLLFAFGRYLMISSSYQCDLPANLQGIWCGSYTPSWESKYTININLQMNYWMVDSCGLSECFEPFVKLLLKVVEKGKTTARRVYGCSGSVAHHNTDC